MSAFVEVKSDFLRAAAQAGWTSPAEVPLAWQDSIPPHVLRRWLRQLGEVVEVNPTNPQRLVNHFKLGADPEFVFLAANGERLDANHLGFKAALAWGADNNGRLCEIRPCPSRHALAVTASVWATLVWMSKFAPATLNCVWRSGAWVAGDGVGGHIHFGRKRPTWPREMQALDTLAFWLQHLNIFNQSEWRERIRRTRSRGNYGQLSDRRPQIHGWEYRTIPSWLDSPWMAYCILTLAKLAVFDPEFLPPLTADADAQSSGTVRAKLRGLLSYFKGRDDDAALAFQVFSRFGWPHFNTTDFKQRWGIFGGGNEGIQTPPPFTIPSMIPPTSQLLSELAQALTNGRVPEWPECPPSWPYATLPEGYIQAISETQTYHSPGIGEIVRDLVVSAGAGHPKFHASANSRCDIPRTTLPRDSEAWFGKMRQRFPEVGMSSYMPERRENNPIYLPGSLAANPKSREQLIAFLTNGWAPIWLISEVKKTSLEEWQASKKAAKAEPKVKREVSVVLWPPKEAAAEKKVEKKVVPGTTPMTLDWAQIQTVQYTTYTSPGLSQRPQPVADGRGNVVDGNTGRPLRRNFVTNEWVFVEPPEIEPETNDPRR